MSFSFNFLSTEGGENYASSGQTLSQHDKSESFGRQEKRSATFHWTQNDASRSLFERTNSNNESVVLGRGLHSDEGNCNNYILRVGEESKSFSDKATDLIPGIYEGGLKVWECSVDMCRYFLQNDIKIGGHVLELGCGHGLPGLWILRNIITSSCPDRADCFVTFSDYNEFVIKDVTMPNVAINVRDAFSAQGIACPLSREDDIDYWIANHVAFGAGDWLAMSDLLLDKGGDTSLKDEHKQPALPKNGFYDVILASETTYSETAAFETADLLSRHLKPGSGVGYVCTKRYYFGVGGGTKCFCDALQNLKHHRFHVNILEIYDNGAGNIRELLQVKSLGIEN